MPTRQTAISARSKRFMAALVCDRILWLRIAHRQNDPLRWDPRHGPLQRPQKLLVLLWSADGHAEGLRRSPRSAHLTNDDAIVLQGPAKAGRIFAHATEKEVCPRGSHANSHV